VEELSPALAGLADEDEGNATLLARLRAEISTSVKVKAGGCRRCKFDWVPKNGTRGNGPQGLAPWSYYQRRVAGSQELYITTPGGIKVGFDGGEVEGISPPHTAIEAKYGYQWMFPSNWARWSPGLTAACLRVSVQIPTQALISAFCGVKYEVRIFSQAGVDGFEKAIPFPSGLSPYRHVP
jgi:hypothetical protein